MHDINTCSTQLIRCLNCLNEEVVQLARKGDFFETSLDFEIGFNTSRNAIHSVIAIEKPKLKIIVPTQCICYLVIFQLFSNFRFNKSRTTTNGQKNAVGRQNY